MSVREDGHHCDVCADNIAEMGNSKNPWARDSGMIDRYKQLQDRTINLGQKTFAPIAEDLVKRARTPNAGILNPDYMGYDLCEANGHQVEDLTYSVDRLIGSCSQCRQQVVVRSLPGSITALRAKALIENYAATRLADLINTPEFGRDEVISELRLLKKMLSLDIEEIELAQSRLTLVECDILGDINEDLVDLQN